jgi:hypothetical protein
MTKGKATVIFPDGTKYLEKIRSRKAERPIVYVEGLNGHANGCPCSTCEATRLAADEVRS